MSTTTGTTSTTSTTRPTSAPGGTRRNRRTLIIVGVLCAMLLVGLAAAAPFTPLVAVREVRVDGTHTLSADEVRSLAGIESGTPMGRVPVHQAAENIAADPWVKTVTVSRSWPSTIAVEVVEHFPVAFVEQADGVHLIDSEGKDFIIAQPPAGAIELRAASIDDRDALADAVAIAASISDQARGDVAAIECRPNNFELLTGDGRRVFWGASEDNENKAIALEAVLQMEGREFNISNPALVTSR